MQVMSTSRDAARPAGEVWRDAASCFRAWSDGETGESGLAGLVELMTPVLWHVVRAYRLPPDVAEDVVQTTWLALVRRRDAIEDPLAIGGWLTTTARREAWRSSKATGHDIPADDADIAIRLPRQRSAESVAVESDENDRLWQAVDQLSERCRRLLRIVAFENRPDYQQVAQTLDMPVGSIGPTRGRCLGKLKAALQQIDSETRK